MIAGLLLRHYKNYANVRFVPVANDTEHKFSVYIGNNGVGKKQTKMMLKDEGKISLPPTVDVADAQLVCDKNKTIHPIGCG